MAESAQAAAIRAAEPLMDEIRREAERAADRRVVDRVVATDERGRRRTRGGIAARAALAAVSDPAGDEWLKTADQLTPGEFVQIDGMHYRFAGLTGDGKLRLFLGEQEFTFAGAPGRRYVFHEGAF